MMLVQHLVNLPHIWIALEQQEDTAVLIPRRLPSFFQRNLRNLHLQ
ncbi:MAG: hypothetical protein KC449_00155 [Anaerolineales bacterium]|nr:hypothetical protein [Anaerolineales bacterium]